MNTYQSYPKTKPSGVAWLGEVPEGWGTIPVFSNFRRIKETNCPDLPLLSVYRDYGVIPKASRDDNFNKASDDLNAYQRIQPGDLVLNKMKAWQGSIGVSSHEGIVSPAYFTYRPTKKSTAFVADYLHHLVRSLEYIAFYLSRSKGIRVNQWDLDPDEFRSTPLICPPLPEQIQIAAFLDRECGKLDALLAKQQRLIELLTEKRQALISHAVTRGLDPAAPLQPSGIDWLGDVPAHWEIEKLWWHFGAEKGKDSQRLTKEFCADNLGEYPVYSGQTANEGVMGLIDHYDYDEGESGVLFATTVGAKAMELKYLTNKFSLSQNCMIIRPRHARFDIRFYLHHFTPLFSFERQMIPDHMQPSFRVEDLLSYRIALPPLAEQRAIVAHLDDKCGKIDRLKAKAERAIELLKERRSAFISAAVTGKIDVRNT